MPRCRQILFATRAETARNSQINYGSQLRFALGSKWRTCGHPVLCPVEGTTYMRRLHQLFQRKLYYD